MAYLYRGPRLLRRICSLAPRTSSGLRFVSVFDYRLPSRLSSFCVAKVNPVYFNKKYTTLVASSRNDDYEEFYRCTSGRWLWDEEEQLRKRYKRFDVPALQRVACESVGAGECKSMSKIADGQSYKVFRLVMDNGLIVIARVPVPNIGSTRLIMASEVASMDFARTVLEIPVPKVLAWSGVVDNPVGSEYMLVEEARGTRLRVVWGDMEFTNVVKVIEDITTIQSKFSSVEFTRHGNLYLASDAFPGCEKAIVAGAIPQWLKQDVESRFVIGPVTEKDFWHAERASMSIDRGPWTSPTSYLQAICKCEIAWLAQHAQHAKPKPQRGLTVVSEDQRNPSAHIALYEKFLKVATYLIPQGRLSSPTLWQWDITQNIFVENNRISSIIDWRDCWIGPRFLQARHPQLVQYSGEMMLDLPKDFETLTNKEEEARIWSQVEKTLVLLTYETHSKDLSALLESIERVPQRQDRRDIVDMAGGTWEGSLIPLRQCLIRVARYWDEISPDTPCPIEFTAEEIEQHHRDGEGWNECVHFWDRMQGFVTRDGWTANEDYDRALEVFAEIKDSARETFSAKEWVEFDKATRWLEKRG